MTNVLEQFVLDNIWCTPGQDQELIMKPGRLHSSNPIFNSLNFLGREIKLPTQSSGWFIYQVGTYYESQDQLPLYQHVWEMEQWRLLTQPLIESNVLTTLYTSKGIVFPLFRSYYLFTKEKALLIAVEHNNIIPANLSTEDLYLRFYVNAFYNSSRSSGTDYNLQTGGSILTAASDITAINTQIQTLITTRGYCTLTINGQRYKTPDTTFVSAGDYVEWIYDPTVEHVETYLLSSAPTYTSSLDSESKSILHSSSTSYFTTIEYQDDLEVDLFMSLSSSVSYGAHYPISSDRSIRMLTHRDYALSSSILTAVINSITTLNPSTQPVTISVEVKFRKSGYDRPIYPNTSLVKDLYTLPNASILNALIQDPVTFATFSAPTMENSPYIQAMKDDQTSITQEFSETVLGYNFISFYYGVENIKATVAGSVKSTPIPIGYQSGCTGYEYNVTGQYLENHTSSSGSIYTATNLNCNMIELMKGLADFGPSSSCGNNDLIYIPNHAYRVFACDQISDVPQYNWTDITDTSDYTIDTTANIVSWTNPSDTRYMMIRDDSKFTTNTFTQLFNNNLMTFQLTEYMDRGQGDGILQYPIAVPGSDITLFMNTRSLVRNMDYFIDFPNVYITNFNYLNQDVATQDQFFHYRVTGLGNGSLQFEYVLDSGVVNNGYVGTSGKYVPKNDKPIRISIDGYIKIASTLKFSQDYPTGNNPTNSLNGLPYQVQHYVVPVSEYLNDSQESLREIANTLDSNLKTFMNANFIFPTRATETTIASPYKLICPFHSKITDDILSGVITTADVDPTLTDSEVETILAPYMYLLNVSPCNTSFGYVGNSSFTIVPTPRSAAIHLSSANQINFIVRSSALAAPGAIDDVGNYYYI